MTSSATDPVILFAMSNYASSRAKSISCVANGKTSLLGIFRLWSKSASQTLIVSLKSRDVSLQNRVELDNSSIRTQASNSGLSEGNFALGVLTPFTGGFALSATAATDGD